MKIVIVGGGLGGLSAAVSLAKHGAEVKVFEKNEHFGGKMMAVDEKGYHFDFGPNTITMPEVFYDVIRQSGMNPHKSLPMVKLTHHTRNQFSDGTYFDFSTDAAYMKEQLKAVDPKGFENYNRFLEEIRRLYQLSRKHFLHRTFSGWKDYFSLSLASSMSKVRPLESLDHFFRKYFDHPGVIQALNRYSTYVGSSPYDTPATFAMIAHLELGEGVYYVRGGNTKIAERFVEAAETSGAELYNNQRVVKILTEGQRAKGVLLESGEVEEADYVIVNGDLLQAVPDLIENDRRKKLSDQKINSFDPSISAFVIMAGLDTRLDELKHHHVLFSRNYEREFEQLKRGEYADDPTIYICTSSKTDPSVSPYGDNCFLLINAPAGGSSSKKDLEAYKQHIYKRLNEAGLPIQNHIKVERVVSPEDIETKFGAYRGSLYGPSSNRRHQAFMRPFNKSQDIENLYFCGGSTHPGGGSPMVVLSGQNVANEILGKLVHIE
ncbi:phytoene desaturase family protein [Halobacillus yeomjeoni]|uniref:Phytoene desaturase n=1 Tax=Halobacillus yeomjeoni TaxID=311194 RepID=A0A931HTG3_9BACI|nr:phytoene desaturase family protein [Halobacillus yeomjeoni]MBH0228941.1 phytoene desaturase [Halobacillus yeomjeoni]